MIANETDIVCGRIIFVRINDRMILAFKNFLINLTDFNAN